MSKEGSHRLQPIKGRPLVTRPSTWGSDDPGSGISTQAYKSSGLEVDVPSAKPYPSILEYAYLFEQNDTHLCPNCTSYSQMHLKLVRSQEKLSK